MWIDLPRTRLFTLYVPTYYTQSMYNRPAAFEGLNSSVQSQSDIKNMARVRRLQCASLVEDLDSQAGWTAYVVCHHVRDRWCGILYDHYDDGLLRTISGTALATYGDPDPIISKTGLRIILINIHAKLQIRSLSKTTFPFLRFLFQTRTCLVRGELH